MKAMIRHLVSLASVCLVLAVVAAPAGATSFVMVADEDLVDQAPVIAEVQVLSIDVTTDTPAPMTEYRMAVEGVVRGDVAASPLSVRVLGGERNDSPGLWIYGAPRFATGERALVFLKPQDDGSYRILHFMQGAFHLVEHGGVEYAVRHLSEASELELPGKAKAPRGPRRLDLFRAWLTDRTLGIEREVDYFVEESEVALRGELGKYELLGNPPIRFREFDTGGSLVFRAHASGQPGLAGGGFSEFQQGLGAWRGDSNTDINIFYGGTTNSTAGFNGGFDGVNAILFDDIGSTSEFDEPFSCTSGGTVALGGPWITPASNHQYNGTTFRAAAGADIVTNKGIDCLSGGQPWISRLRRAAEVFAHELGHTLGLAHSCGDPTPSCNSTLSDALMFPFVHGDNRGARLGSDDRAGIRFIYGTPETEPSAPSGLTATAVGQNRIDLDWNDNSDNETSFEVQRQAGSGSFQTIATVGTNVRSYQDEAVFPGTTFTYRVRSRNSAGVSSYSNTASTMTAGNPEPCVPGPETLCLNDGRFKVEVNWVDFEGDEGVGTDLELPSIDSGLMWFFTDNNWELLVKVLDGCDINNHFWVFAAATTDVEYEMVVTDSFTGLSRVYSNDLGVSAPAVTDTGAFATCEAVPPSSAPAAVSEPAKRQREAEVAKAGPVEKQGSCAQTATRLCLNDNRFAVDISWVDFEGGDGFGLVDMFQSGDSGLMYFFDPQNLEVLVKVLDGCDINNRVWVFAAATTNVGYTMTVTDTLTGAMQIYQNPLGVSSPAVTDTNAFMACP